MKRTILLSIAVFVCIAGSVFADTFGTAGNQFEIDFVPISGDSGDLGSWAAGNNYTFSGVNHGDYRMGTNEITNDQWSKFVAAHGQPNGSPSTAYDDDSYWTGAGLPTNNISWYEAAQFVNWLNIDAGKSVAYKFVGIPGTSDYTLGVWDTFEAWGGTNLYRHKDAFYFLPTDDEWVKAAYWNGSSLQTYATKAGESLTQGDGISGTGWNYYDGNPYGPWNVGSGSEELNGTFDMMGNVWEWMENTYYTGDYLPGSTRGLRGGAYHSGDLIASSGRGGVSEYYEGGPIGFRVASVPEPTTLLLLGLGGLLTMRIKRK